MSPKWRPLPFLLYSSFWNAAQWITATSCYTGLLTVSCRRPRTSSCWGRSARCPAGRRPPANGPAMDIVSFPTRGGRGQIYWGEVGPRILNVARSGFYLMIKKQLLFKKMNFYSLKKNSFRSNYKINSKINNLSLDFRSRIWLQNFPEPEFDSCPTDIRVQ